MMKRGLIWTGWIAIALLATYLRMQNLGTSPVHFDEATGARLLGKQLEGEHPRFDASHFHGPWLRKSAVPIARLRSENDWKSLSVETLRLNTVIAGLLLCFTPLLWRKEIGMLGTMAASALLATSPLIVYYNRMFIHESWIALFGMLACASVFRYLQKPSSSMGILGGISIGLMFATKETFAISILSWGFAAATLLWLDKKPSNTHGIQSYLKSFAWLGFAAVITSAYFYTEGFSHPTGYLDAFRTFLSYETTPGHEKPFLYYAYNLLWPKFRLGHWWSESMIALMALAALGFTRGNGRPSAAIVFVALSALAHFLIYSIIRYKTPWLVLLPWAHLCLLAGMAFDHWKTTARITRIALSILLMLTLLWQSRQSTFACGRFANDIRNPYAYVPTSEDTVRLASWLNELNAMHSLSTAAVIGSEYWPLPWYLRSLDEVGYWPEPKEAFRDYSIVFAMPEQVGRASDLLENTHVPLPRGLRNNVSLMVYLRNDIWEQWNGEPIK